MYRLKILVTRGTSTMPASQLNIQPAIKRTPTEMLEALASTVGTDPTAPHFSFIDDPAMIPTTASQKRNYYMAKELGRRAARQLAEEWPTLFAFDREVPRLNAFRPQKEEDPAHMEVTEASLLKLIDARRIQDAIILFEKLRENNIVISQETKKKIFFLFVYYGGNKIPNSEEVELHGLRVFSENQLVTWKEDMINLIYETIEQNTEVESAMICGICKFSGSIKRAQQLFEEMISKNEKPCVEAFNSLISISQFSDALKIIQTMRTLSMAPNLATFNSLLQSNLQTPSINRQETAQKIFGEMRLLKIKPSLLSYDYLLKSIVRFAQESHAKADVEDNKANLKIGITVLNEILNEISTSIHETQHEMDHLFFLTAMNLCLATTNLEMARRLVEFYESNNNKVKAPEFTFENSFYTRYLKLYIEATNDLNEIEKVYKDYVPNRVGVFKNLVSTISNRLRFEQNWSFTKRLVQDAICAHMLTDGRMCFEIRSMLKNINFSLLSPFEREDFSDLVRKVVNALVELSEFTEEHNKRLQQKLFPYVIVDCCLLLTKIGDDNYATDLLKLLINEETKDTSENSTVLQQGTIKAGPLQDLFDHALQQKNIELAAIVFEIMSRDMPREQLKLQSNRLMERCRLNTEQTRIIEGFVRLRPE